MWIQKALYNSKFIIVWAHVILLVQISIIGILLKRHKEGWGKVVVIDSYASRTAKKTDWHVCPKPGTDGALAMAMMNVIEEEGLVDQDYVDNYTVGFNELAEKAKERSPEWAEEITGIKSKTLEN